MQVSMLKAKRKDMSEHWQQVKEAAHTYSQSEQGLASTNKEGFFFLRQKAEMRGCAMFKTNSGDLMVSKITSKERLKILNMMRSSLFPIIWNHSQKDGEMASKGMTEILVSLRKGRLCKDEWNDA